VSPDPALVKAMSSEAVSKAKDFNPQAIAILLWALAMMDAPPDSVLVREMLAKFALCDFDVEGQLQLHVFFPSNSIAPHPLNLFSWADPAAACKAAFLARSSSYATSSKLQKDVARSLRKIVSRDILEEQVLQDSGYSVDIQLADSKVVVEVDGPSHYLRGAGQKRMMDGSTQFKARILRQLGWTVLQVPYFDWNALNNADSSLEIASKTRYLSALLADAGVSVSASAKTKVVQP
jgi:very-short-patch-repair endonuclease